MPSSDPVAATILLALFTAALLNYYRSTDVSWLVTVVIYVSWFLGFAGILLLPFDIAFTQVGPGPRMLHPRQNHLT
jgi:hypothetical protein